MLLLSCLLLVVVDLARWIAICFLFRFGEATALYVSIDGDATESRWDSSCDKDGGMVSTRAIPLWHTKD